MWGHFEHGETESGYFKDSFYQSHLPNSVLLPACTLRSVHSFLGGGGAYALFAAAALVDLLQ